MNKIQSESELTVAIQKIIASFELIPAGKTQDLTVAAEAMAHKLSDLSSRLAAASSKPSPMHFTLANGSCQHIKCSSVHPCNILSSLEEERGIVHLQKSTVRVTTEKPIYSRLGLYWHATHECFVKYDSADIPVEQFLETHC